MFQVCEKFATQWASKDQHIPKHQLLREKIDFFTGKVRSCLPYSLLFLSGSLGLVKSTGSGSAHRWDLLNAEGYSPDNGGKC